MECLLEFLATFEFLLDTWALIWRPRYFRPPQRTVVRPNRGILFFHSHVRCISHRGVLLHFFPHRSICWVSSTERSFLLDCLLILLSLSRYILNSCIQGHVLFRGGVVASRAFRNLIDFRIRMHSPRSTIVSARSIVLVLKISQVLLLTVRSDFYLPLPAICMVTDSDVFRSHLAATAERLGWWFGLSGRQSLLLSLRKAFMYPGLNDLGFPSASIVLLQEHALTLDLLSPFLRICASRSKAPRVCLR
mmetsp:Transcript_30762/g.53968  ORF Transcript_30762/g.53968 Transcript_30762/m.53968 type:complete len:248 (+) Transcript_30762:1061-1804(+)